MREDEDEEKEENHKPRLIARPRRKRWRGRIGVKFRYIASKQIQSVFILWPVVMDICTSHMTCPEQ